MKSYTFWLSNGEGVAVRGLFSETDTEYFVTTNSKVYVFPRDKVSYYIVC